MKYKLKGISRRGNEETFYFHCPECPLAKERIAISHNHPLVEMLELEQGYTPLEGFSEAIPGEQWTVDAEVYTASLPYVCKKMYTTHVTDERGCLIHRQGDIVCDESGKPIRFGHIEVFWPYVEDEECRIGIFGTREEMYFQEILNQGFVKYED